MPSKKRATPISLQPLDALFGTNEETNNGICEIEIGSLHPFPNGKCERGSRKTISKRSRIEPYVRATVGIKCFAEYG